MTALRLILDLGDALSKGLALHKDRRRPFRYPSVVAKQLVAKGRQSTDLLLSDTESVLRPTDFEAQRFPRNRSYPEGEQFRQEVEEVPRARFAGLQAVAHGADRQLLGHHPTIDNIDALVHKAFLLSALAARDVELVLAVDSGPKADAIERYARDKRTAKLLAWKPGDSNPRRLDLTVRARIIDAATCAIACLPPPLAVEEVERVLLVDIGYLRSKFLIVSGEGCEHQSVVDIGVSDCVKRVLRDGQDRGLFEDEFAVIRGIEQSHTVIDIAGRRFDIRSPLASAVRGLEEELARAALRAIASHFDRTAASCKAVAVFGGGAALAGKALAARLKETSGVERAWVCPDSRFALLRGAERVLAAPSRSAER